MDTGNNYVGGQGNNKHSDNDDEDDNEDIYEWVAGGAQMPLTL